MVRKRMLHIDRIQNEIKNARACGQISIHVGGCNFYFLSIILEFFVSKPPTIKSRNEVRTEKRILVAWELIALD